MLQKAGAAPSRLDFLRGQPAGLAVLFFTELWERFSYYGMRALLIFYLTRHFLFTDAQSFAIYGSYTALVYTAPLIGGLVADRWLGTRRAVVLGAVLLAFGHFTMALEGAPAQALVEAGRRVVVRDERSLALLYFALALIVAGTGFIKANISTMVGQLYAPGDKRRDTGFTLFYLGINLGAFAAALACGYLGERYGWRYGFGLAGAGMLAGLLVFWRGTAALAGVGEPPRPALLSTRMAGPVTVQHAIYAVAALMVGAAWLLLQAPRIMDGTLGLVCAGAAALLLGYALFSCPRVERDRLIVALVLMVFTVVFWALFEQAGSSLNLFAARNVDRQVLGVMIPAAQLQSLNPLFIIILALPFGWMWHSLALSGRRPSTPLSFAVGLALLGLGYFVLVRGADHAGANAQVGLVFLALFYLLQTMGELCLSPLGLSAVTKLAPPQILGFAMGAAFLPVAAGQLAAAKLATTAALAPAAGSGLGLSAGLEAYTQLFHRLGWCALGAAALLALLSPLLKRMMHGAD